MNDISNVVKNAIGNFLIINVKISKKSFKKQLPKHATERIAKKIARDSSPDGGKVVGGDTQVPMFGPYQKEFERMVNAPKAEFRNNDIYTLLELDGGRAITTADFPTVFPRIEAKAQAISDHIRNRAEGHYEKWVEAGKSSAVRTYGRVYPHILQWLEYPTLEEFIEENGEIKVSTPRVISSLANVNLPANLIETYAKRHEAKAEEMLEGARVKAIDNLQEHLKLVVTQLGEGKRFHQSLADTLKAQTRSLRSFVEAYDNDVRLTSILDVIEEKVQVNDVDIWKNQWDKRSTSRQAAETVSKQLDGLRDRVAPTQAATANTAVINNGLDLPDLF